MQVEYKKESRIAIFIISRPEVLNALSRQTWQALSDAMADFYENPELRVGVITGIGDKAFSAGDDIREMRAGSE